jgi:hypothetical protein
MKEGWIICLICENRRNKMNQEELINQCRREMLSIDVDNDSDGLAALHQLMNKYGATAVAAVMRTEGFE